MLRGVQGLGAALIMPATLSILTNVFTDPDERGRAIGLWAGVSGLGVAIGPLVGGFLLEHFWWGSVFLVNVPIIVFAVIAVVLVVPNSRDEHAPRLDFVGTLLVTPGLMALLYGIIEGPGRGWTDPLVVAAFIAAVVLAGQLRAVGAADRLPDPRRQLLQEPALHRGVHRDHPGVLRHVRHDVLRQPVPAVRARATRRSSPVPH